MPCSAALCHLLNTFWQFVGQEAKLFVTREDGESFQRAREVVPSLDFDIVNHSKAVLDSFNSLGMFNLDVVSDPFCFALLNLWLVSVLEVVHFDCRFNLHTLLDDSVNYQEVLIQNRVLRLDFSSCFSHFLGWFRPHFDLLTSLLFELTKHSYCHIVAVLHVQI